MTRDAAKRYCADPAFLNRWDKAARDRVNSAAEVADILETGNPWKNGIGDFTPNVIESDPTELVTLRFPGTFKKIGARTCQVELRRFRPAADLDVFFGNPVDAADDTRAEMPRLNR